MKLEERVLDVDSTLTGERVGMAVGEDALAHIMAVLTDLYSDPELAIIREYSTNALDSQIDAGVARPIEVTTPTPLSAFLKIRDFGLGLDAEGIRTVYSQYGVSTKRDSDDVVGMLGLGCKSALTYTDQFMLTGIKDGVQTQVSIGRDEDGGGSMTIVSVTDTTEPNGVLVVIPAKKDNQFERKARAFFRWWDEGTVLLNGDIPTSIKKSMTKITDALYTTDAVESSLVVMGNVPYPIPDEYLQPTEPTVRQRQYGSTKYVNWFGQSTGYARPNEHLVAFVPIGSVNFAPSREALRETKRTKETVTACIAEARKTLKDSLFAQVAAAKTAVEAQEMARKCSSMGIVEKPLWLGREVLLSLSRESKVPAWQNQRDDTTLFLIAPRYQGRGRLAGDRTSSVHLSNSFIVLNNFTGKDLTPTKRAKLDLYLTSKPPKEDWTSIVAVDLLEENEKFWLSGRTIIDFEKDVEPLKLPKTVASDGTARPRGSYSGYKGGKWETGIPADTIDVSKTLIYVNGNHYHLNNTPEARAGFIGEAERWWGGVKPDPDLTVIALPANRVEKFKRDFPTAIELSAYAVAEVKTYLDTLDKEDLKAAHYQRDGSKAHLACLDPAQIDDPVLAEAVKLVKRPVKAILSRMQEQGRWIPRAEVGPKNPLAPYPLIENELSSNSRGTTIDHTYLYVNAVYAAKEDA